MDEPHSEEQAESFFGDPDQPTKVDTQTNCNLWKTQKISLYREANGFMSF